MSKKADLKLPSISSDVHYGERGSAKMSVSVTLPGQRIMVSRFFAPDDMQHNAIVRLETARCLRELAQEIEASAHKK
jgi:hypothetical protein